MFAAYAYAFLNGKLRGQEHLIFVPLLLLLPTYGWLLGFKIRITAKTFEYRNGLWRWQSCSRNEISDAKFCWLEFSNFGRILKFPRLVIQCRERQQGGIVINPKPFSREVLRRVQEILSSE
ncbi:MAG TPA: hypothetical protein PLT00_04765 [Verrucomicrobiota bacterium]|nr:hypothetical protein [Verrucomicrobiota bacterium]